MTVAPNGIDYGINGGNEQGLYAPGDTITVDVAGDGDVPAHTLTATAPMVVTVTTPAIAAPDPQGSLVTIDLSQDLLVEWTNGSTGTLSVGLAAHDAFSERYTSVSCTVEASAGAITIPSAMLSRVLPTDIETTTGFYLALTDTAETTAGDCEVRLSVESSVVSPEGYRVWGPATFH